MSGPTRGDQLYSIMDDMQWTQQKVNDLWSLADRVEKHEYTGSEVSSKQVANLLRKKADVIEACLRTIDNETHDSYHELVKAVQWYESGDYGPERIEEALEEYAEQ